VEIANEIGYTHPSTITLLKELEKLELIQWEKDKQDERKRLFMLTSKGRNLLKNETGLGTDVYRFGDIADNTNNLLTAIDEAEEKLPVSLFIRGLYRLRIQNNRDHSLDYKRVILKSVTRL
jgi:DNA-binding MarR family transcriptional regulator